MPFTKSQPLNSSIFPPLSEQKPATPLGLATTLLEEYSYEAEVEGEIPSDLRGTLYRNGPGLYDRGGLRKRNILDGDGMIQAFKFQDGRVTYQNKYVKTKKYLEEKDKGKFIYPTWTTQPQGGFIANIIGGRIKSQACVTVIYRNNRVYAFDDGLEPYELDPDTLETVGESKLNLPKEYPSTFYAHWKIDGENGDWILLSGSTLDLKILIIDLNGTVKNQINVKTPRDVYIHDFFATENYIILNLHPAYYSSKTFLLGRKSLAESLTWKPEDGNLVLLIHREKTQPPVSFKIEATWMWHSLNAYEVGDNIVAEFVGYDHPDHMLGERSSFYAVMSGEVKRNEHTGEVKRYIINLKDSKIKQETIDYGNHEFPTINPVHQCRQHRYGYFAISRNPTDVFWNGIKKIDMKFGKPVSYNFEKGLYCSEPVFAPKPGFKYTHDSKDEPGYLLTEVYDSFEKKSFLAVFDAENILEGPIARIHLKHHAPFTHHGYWRMM
ncbi:MAG: carotenoid oxygenase family protein [Candidatus Odinarchaeum yellowstonii]|uniref:Carotenoid oxygenase family protein n=1 Tax=Odinarchaeota yellowstonii (strain LCB_4) TaxID=1841599 RepID=A0AAF0IBF6_ODILC|nr:MAG: carotenoid oxygenase family protein [Candidatus Odinarchaeum yellowstonii]